MDIVGILILLKAGLTENFQGELEISL